MLEGAHQLKGLLMLVEKSEYLDEWYGYLEFLSITVSYSISLGKICSFEHLFLREKCCWLPMVNALHKTYIRILSGSRYQLLRTLEERGFRGQDQSVFRELFQFHSSQLSILTTKIIGSDGYI